MDERSASNPGSPAAARDERASALRLIGRIYDAALRPELLAAVLDEIAAFAGADKPLPLTLPGRGAAEGTLAALSSEAHDAVPPAALGRLRSLDPARLGRRARERIQLFVPHLARALEIMRRLRDAEMKSAAAFESLERFGAAVLILEGNGEVSFANRAARRILAEKSGLRLDGTTNGKRRRLVVDDERAQAAIHAALEQCVRGAGETGRAAVPTKVPRAGGRPPYVLRFNPLAAPEGGSARALVLISDVEEGGAPDPRLLRQLYGLTEAEAALAEQLARGVRLSHAATTLNISYNTARTHLKRVFAKVGVSRQPDLVKILLTLSTYR